MGIVTNRKTLCWKCVHAVPHGERGCSWSVYKIPVDGWDAMEDVLRVSPKYSVISYNVKSCPQFEREISDEPFEPGDDAIRLLAAEVVKTAAADYKRACDLSKRIGDFGDYPHSPFDCERFFKSEYGALLADCDLIRLMKQIRKMTGFKREDEYDETDIR